MEGGVPKRKRDEDVGTRSFSAASDSERTAENAKDAGKSIYRGVQFDTKNNRWRARLHTDKTRHVGYYETEEESARAWDQAALRYNCDRETIQRLNFMDESFAKFKEFVEEAGSLDRFLPELKGVEKKTMDTSPPMVVYVASIIHNRSPLTIGEFFSARDAAKAYDWKSIEMFGWGILTNFPLANYEQECIARGGLSGLDNNKMPPFPNIKRFSDSRRALPQLSDGQVLGIDETLQTINASMQKEMVATKGQEANAANITHPNTSVSAGYDNPDAKNPGQWMNIDTNVLLSHLVQQQLQQQLSQLGQHDRSQGMPMPLLNSYDTRLVDASDLANAPSTNQEAVPAPGRSADAVALAVPPPAIDAAAQPPSTGPTATLVSAIPPASTMAPDFQAPVKPPGLVQPPIPIQPTGPTSLMSTGMPPPAIVPAVTLSTPTTHEAVAKVSLGTFDDVIAAQDAMDRAGPMIKGISRLSEDEYKKHVELVQKSQAKLQDKIKEINGEFHVSLKILGKSFELGPYQTAHQARMAHDKYSMVLDGASAQMFYTMTDVLLPREESESLLFALSKIRSGSMPPVEGPAPPTGVHLSAASEIPQSSLVANAFTSTLRKVASQSSLLDDAANLNRQLEKIESSVGKVANVLDQTSPFMSREVTTPCPLPAFPGVPNANISTGAKQPHNE